NINNIDTVMDSDPKYPTFYSVSELYTRILIYLDVLCDRTQVPLEDKRQVDFEALEQLENPDHHATSVPVMNLYVKLKDMLEMVDCPVKIDFRDLLRPDSAQTEFFISALLNFGLHKYVLSASKMELIRPKAEELTLLDEQRRQWEAKIAQLNAENSEFDEACERDLPFVHELETNTDELNQKILGLNNQQLSLRETFQKMRERSTQMDNEISKAEFELVQTVQENANLRSQIVQSPDKLQTGAFRKRRNKCWGKQRKLNNQQWKHSRKRLPSSRFYEKVSNEKL
ncbi:unnamed protein product, partial [Thlaspi arvense]